MLVRYTLLSSLKLLLLPTVPLAAIVISLFTRPNQTNWGWIYGTYDNPPQGDRGYVTKRSPFPNKITGIKGYVNRVMWMIRNPLYGYNKAVGVKWDGGKVVIKGNPNISDKYKISGWMFAKYYDKNNKLKAFEFYCVLPYTKNRNLRARLGYKIKSEKFKQQGFAQLVFTINPFDTYGNN